MPGICGCIGKEKRCVSKMIKSMSLTSRLKPFEIYENEDLGLSQISLKSPRNIPVINDDFAIFIEGKCYNLDEVNQEFNIKANTFEQTLLYSYKTGILPNLLNKIDGYFHACLYDLKKKKVLLLTDRWGMRLLYWYLKDDIFAFSGEVKGILAIDNIDKTIDKTSIDCLMSLGYLVGEHTWFEHIKLMKPASIVEYNIATKKISHSYYWKYSEIKQQNISFDDAVEKLSQLMISSVKKRFNTNEKIAVPISGGLDSRMIIAAMKKINSKYKSFNFTFGIPNCDDIKIAKKVCRTAKQKHHSYHFTNKNWFEPRIEKIWLTDGMLRMSDMHGSEFEEDVSKHSDYIFNGYAGDAVLGPGFKSIDNHFNQRINDEIACVYYQNYVEHADIHDDFYDINHIEPNLYMNRVRRYTNMGTAHWLFYVDNLKPFFDNEIIEFVFSIPDEYRVGNKLYSQALLKTFPEFYENIINANTGKLIIESNNNKTQHNEVLKHLKNSITKVINKIKEKLSIFPKKKNYTDYNAWIKGKVISEKLKKLLTRENAFYAKHTDKDFYKLYLEPHLNNKADYSREILTATTIELYFQKVFSD